MFTFLHQTDKFIRTGDIAAQTFWQWSDNIKPEDDITPFDGTLSLCHNRWQTMSCNISLNFRKNSKRPLWYNKRLGGNWFMKKTRSKKSRNNVPLRPMLLVSAPASVRYRSIPVTIWVPLFQYRTGSGINIFVYSGAGLTRLMFFFSSSGPSKKAESVEPDDLSDSEPEAIFALKKHCHGFVFVIFCVFSSVPDPWHFGVDPDPRIHASDQWIRILIRILDLDPAICLIDIQDASKKII